MAPLGVASGLRPLSRRSSHLPRRASTDLHSPTEGATPGAAEAGYASLCDPCERDGSRSVQGQLQIGPDGACVTLPSRGTFVVGRAADCDVTLDDKLVSRRHCQVECDGDFFWLIDLGSKAGTILNDAPAQKALLYDGDEVVLGGTKITFKVDDQEADLRPTAPMSPVAPPRAAVGESPEPLSPHKLVGKTLGGCEIVRRLDKGGTGYVFEARQLSMDRTVAVKVMAPPPGGDPQHAQRALDLFLQAARSAGQFNHTNVVTVFDAGIEAGLAYLVMEFVDRATLRDVLSYRRKKRSPLPLYTTLTFGIHICRALEHALKKRVVHRNIKPRNILIDSENVAKLTGFGLARRLDDDKSMATAKALESEDVRNYMAPELCRDEEVDHRCDIYSLGAVLYHMVTNQAPFDAPTPLAVMGRVVDEPLAWPDESEAPVPDDVRQACEKAMCPDREGRYDHPDEFNQALCAARRTIKEDGARDDEEG